MPSPPRCCPAEVSDITFRIAALNTAGPVGHPASSLKALPQLRRIVPCGLRVLVVRAMAEGPQLRALVAQRRRRRQVAASLLDLPRTRMEQDAEVESKQRDFLESADLTMLCTSQS